MSQIRHFTNKNENDIAQEEFERYENQVLAEEEHQQQMMAMQHRPTNQNPLDDDDEYKEEQDSSFESSAQDMGEKRRKQLNDLVLSLENELTEQLYSHKIFLEDINRIEEEKNFYYDRLRLIEDFVPTNPFSLTRSLLLSGACRSKSSFLLRFY